MGKGVFLESTKLKAYLTEAYKNINNDPDNVPAAYNILDTSVARIRHHNISVWIYSKALGKIYDVSKYCYNLHTGSNMDSGGTFSISLEGIRDLEDTLTFGDDLVNMYKLEPNSVGQVQMSYFAKYFQQKDVVWLRYEKLSLKKEQKRNTVSQSFEVEPSQLKDQIYDMIGLIENVSESTNYSITERNITITGKDLTLLLSEDASYFYPLLFAMGGDAIMTGGDEGSNWYKRNVFKEGIFESFFTLGERKIKDSIGFVINQLSNLGVVPSTLFKDFEKNDLNKGDRSGQRRKQALRITSSGNSNTDYLKWSDVQGIWQIIDVFCDEKLDNRVQIDAMLQKAEGSLLGMMQSFCQQPLVEFTGDTFGDKYVFFARQPIFNKESVRDFISKNFIVEIEAKDVYNQNLDWETQFYTSYEIRPNASFLAYDHYTALSYIPMVFFSTIAEDYGNHPYSISDSYIDERSLPGGGASPTITAFRESVIADLSLIIETTAYLPFTRKGSLTINGDRRIKKGTWIYFKPTNEIYYVSSVDQDFSCSSKTIDRTTTLTVERGMIRDYALGIERNGVKYSYFDIVDITLMETLMKASDAVNGTIKTTPDKVKKAAFDVNPEVYKFFKTRKQLEGVIW
jgi:hypothetical protein